MDSRVRHTRKCAFTMVELAVVLVIVGLIAGGVIIGQSLIHNAAVNSIAKDYNNFTSAVRIFEDKYRGVPGDIANATKYWGQQSGAVGCTNNTGAAANVNGTCDGTGEGAIGGISVMAANTSGEAFQFWRQLALEGLIGSKYSGVSVAAETLKGYPGINIPDSRVSGAGWGARTLEDNPVTTAGYYSGDTVTYAAVYGHIFTYGAPSTGDDLPNEPILSGADALNLDIKMDDGKPGTGKVMARYWNNACANASSNTDYTASYIATGSAIKCAFYFPDAF